MQPMQPLTGSSGVKKWPGQSTPKSLESSGEHVTDQPTVDNESADSVPTIIAPDTAGQKVEQKRSSTRSKQRPPPLPFIPVPTPVSRGSSPRPDSPHTQTNQIDSKNLMVSPKSSPRTEPSSPRPPGRQSKSLGATVGSPRGSASKPSRLRQSLDEVRDAVSKVLTFSSDPEVNAVNHLQKLASDHAKAEFPDLALLLAQNVPVEFICQFTLTLLSISDRGEGWFSVTFTLDGNELCKRSVFKPVLNTKVFNEASNNVWQLSALQMLERVQKEASGSRSLQLHLLDVFTTHPDCAKDVTLKIELVENQSKVVMSLGQMTFDAINIPGLISLDPFLFKKCAGECEIYSVNKIAYDDYKKVFNLLYCSGSPEESMDKLANLVMKSDFVQKHQGYAEMWDRFTVSLREDEVRRQLIADMPRNILGYSEEEERMLRDKTIGLLRPTLIPVKESLQEMIYKKFSLFIKDEREVLLENFMLIKEEKWSEISKEEKYAEVLQPIRALNSEDLTQFIELAECIVKFKFEFTDQNLEKMTWKDTAFLFFTFTQTALALPAMIKEGLRNTLCCSTELQITVPDKKKTLQIVPNKDETETVITYTEQICLVQGPIYCPILNSVTILTYKISPYKKTFEEIGNLKRQVQISEEDLENKTLKFNAVDNKRRNLEALLKEQKKAQKSEHVGGGPEINSSSNLQEPENLDQQLAETKVALTKARGERLKAEDVYKALQKECIAANDRNSIVAELTGCTQKYELLNPGVVSDFKRIKEIQTTRSALEALGHAFSTGFTGDFHPY